MTRWLFAVTPTFFPARTSATIICAAVNVLPLPGGPWIGRVVSSRASPRRTAESSGGSPGLRSGVAGATDQPWRAAPQELARRAEPTATREPMLDHPVRDPRERVLLLVGIDELARDERVGQVHRQLLGRPVERDRQRDLVDRANGADALRPRPCDGRRIDDRPPDPEAMVLRRKPVQLENAALPDRLEIRDVVDPPERLALVDELLVGHAGELVEAPPERLVLAPVPTEQLGEEPARRLVVRPCLGLVRHAGRERRDQLLDAQLALAELLRRLGDTIARTGHGVPEPALQLRSAFLEPVAQAQVADDVIAVVARDLAQDRLADLPVLGGATLQPGLEGDDARAGAPQLDLALQPVERLEALDRVALDARADPLADDAIQVDRARRPGAGDRPRAPASRGAGRAGRGRFARTRRSGRRASPGRARAGRRSGRPVPRTRASPRSGSRRRPHRGSRSRGTPARPAAADPVRPARGRRTGTRCRRRTRTGRPRCRRRGRHGDGGGSTRKPRSGTSPPSASRSGSRSS